MDVDAAATPQSYTILRIKRKRNEEPLDALVVESRVRRKKSRGGIGVFQYAHTVENDAWKDERSQKDIQDRISRLAREGAANLGQSVSISNTESANPAPVRQKKDFTPRYTVVRSEEESQTQGQATNLSRTQPIKELAQNSRHPDFRMYDAILSKRKALQTNGPDLEMEKFLPLLNDYLKIHDMASSSNPKIVDTPPETNDRIPGPVDDADDYVWDVFYHRPTTLSEWNSAAARTGTLTGLSMSALDSDESTSGSEPEDEADEDSNAEEYYKNDYPEEEPESDSEQDNSDEFHEESDNDPQDDEAGF